MTPVLSISEMKERVQKMRDKAASLNVYTSIIGSTTPEKQQSIEKIKELSREILDLLEVLEK